MLLERSTITTTRFLFSWITLGNEPPLSSALISLPMKTVPRKAWRSAATLCNSVPGDGTPSTRITRHPASRSEDLPRLNSLQESGDLSKESLVTTEENHGTKQRKESKEHYGVSVQTCAKILDRSTRKSHPLPTIPPPGVILWSTGHLYLMFAGVLSERFCRMMPHARHPRAE